MTVPEELAEYPMRIGGRAVGAASGVTHDSAIKAYTETKAVWVELTGATRDPFTLG